MLGEKKLKEIAKKVLSLSGADETEVLLFVTNHGLTRFANSQIHQNVASEDLGVSVRVAKGKRVGVASGNSFQSMALADVVRRAEELARLQKEDPCFKSLPKPQKIPRVEKLVHQISPEERAKAVATIIKKAKAKKIIASGAFDSVISEIAVANSWGLWGYHAGSLSDLSTILQGEDSSGFASQLGRKASEIKAEEVADQAIEKVMRGKEPRALKPAEMEVILEPQAVSEMLAFFAWLGPNARIYHEEASHFSGRLGETVFSEKVTIVDDPLDPEGIPMPFDFEGVPKRRLEIIKEGVLRNLVYDSYHAGKYGEENTGHGLPAPNTEGPIPLHLRLEPGEKSLEEMIKGVKKGILVSRLWYVRTLNPRYLTITGMTRDGTFLIENGQVVGGVKNLRFNQSIPEALQNVVEIGKKLTTLTSLEMEFGANRLPALRIGNWHFTSGTEF
ncbi:TldD/PmbA family protein [Candidatus Shapirobacteria bacterium]|nr:TldD/PmbA family protein [Candidatus Shapirobacteria bacterium]